MSAPPALDAATLINPWLAVKERYRFCGTAGALDLPRLVEALAEAGGDANWPARYEVAFDRTAEGHASVSGSLTLTLRLVCQRCLGELVLPVDAQLSVGLVRTAEAADALPESLDPVLVLPEGLRPLELVEDELLLAIPHVPTHSREDCSTILPASPPAMAVAERPNPFAVLAALKAAAPHEPAPGASLVPGVGEAAPRGD